jgi:GT2 family glycosyltransferase
MTGVAAVVINKNTKDLLRECLRSIEAQEYPGEISVWVVDNASTDGSAGVALSEFPSADLVWNSLNVGYARACNQGIKATSEPVVMIMNSDVELSRDTVRVLVDYMESNPRAGIAAPMLLNSDGSLQFSCREFPSIKTAFVHAFLGLFSGENAHSASYKKMDWDHTRPSEVPWVSGAFMGLRRAALEEVGGFDEKYFMYVEDVDLCWRMWRSGWSVGYVPGGEVVHHIGMSSKAVPARMVLHHHMSMLRFHRKTYEGPAKTLVAALVAVGLVVRSALIMALNASFRVRQVFGGAAKVIMPGRQ